MNNEKANMLWLSDSPFTVTGFASQSRDLMNRCSNSLNKNILAHNYFGQDIAPGATTSEGTVLNPNFTICGTGLKPHSQDILPFKIKQLKPKIFGILLDTFMTYPWILNVDFSPAKSLFYFPSDGGAGLPVGCEQLLQKFDKFVAMAKFGQRQVKDYYGAKVDYIQHGVDTSIFTPLSSTDRQLLKKARGLQDKFVVGSVCRNQGRKTMDRLIKTFAKFCVDKPDTILFLHTDPNDPASVFRITELIKRYGIENRVMFSGMTCFQGFDLKQINAVYNLMDVFLLTTSGEGFGVPIVEAMSCGIPQVVTDYTTTPELLVEDGKTGLPAKLVGTEEMSMTELLLDKGKSMKEIDLLIDNGTFTGSWNVERGLCDAEHAAEQLTKLYNSDKLRKQLSVAGRTKALGIYDWKHPVAKWNKLFEEMSQ